MGSLARIAAIAVISDLDPLGHRQSRDDNNTGGNEFYEDIGKSPLTHGKSKAPAQLPRLASTRARTRVMDLVVIRLSTL
jgi:hypothetical protein